MGIDGWNMEEDDARTDACSDGGGPDCRGLPSMSRQGRELGLLSVPAWLLSMLWMFFLLLSK